MFVPATINFDRASTAGGDRGRCVLAGGTGGGDAMADVIRLAHSDPVIKSVSILC